MARITVRLDEKTNSLIEEIARTNQITKSDVVIEALREYLGNYTNIPSLKKLNDSVQILTVKLNELNEKYTALASNVSMLVEMVKNESQKS